MSDDGMIRRGDAIALFEYNENVPTQSVRSMLKSLPAVHVAVKPGEIERAVWSAMIWAAENNPGFNGVPEYTDGGNSFAETECRATASRIRSALTSQPSPDVAIGIRPDSQRDSMVIE